MEQQQPRGVLPDALAEPTVYLFKGCSYLRLTYEIRQMAFMAQQNDLEFAISIPHHCELAPSLKEFIDENRVQIQRS